MPITDQESRSYHHGVGRRCGVGRGRGVTLGVAVGVGVELGVGVTVGAGLDVGDTEGVGVTVGVGVGGGPDCAQYLPPVSKSLASSVPPQTIIWLPVQTAV